MDNLIETIRNAIAPNATDETRAAGAQACRTILAALETPAGEPLKASTVPTASIDPTSPLHVALAAMRTMPLDQLLDVAIAKLRMALPADAVAPVQRINIPLVRIPPP